MIVSMKPLYVALEDVPKVIPLSESTIQKLIRDDDFPKPRVLSGRRVGWKVSELEEWAENRPVSELPPPPNTSAGGRKKKKAANEPGIQDEHQAA